ncbi:hypothetical protein KFE25_011250 [Diacronema lutheri]|uniref:Ferrochelatase n=2 Tax=Diacronema lutheri TaxID=2081491 RepID=A0A8J6CD76_DIALT|nr:hypothetical protein KFE25_011250 [Diacronema lutheri]
MASRALLQLAAAAALLAPRVGGHARAPAVVRRPALRAAPRALRMASAAPGSAAAAAPQFAVGAASGTGGTGAPAKLGVLLLSQGAPDSAVDLESYLFNIFQDPEVVTIPKSVLWAKTPLAWAIAKSSAAGLKASTDGLLDAVSISESQQLRTVQQQAAALEAALRERGVSASAFIAMRYWEPYIPQAIQAIKEARVTHLVILPLFPQFSLSTSGSSLRVLEAALDSDADFGKIQNTVIPSWYKQPKYVDALARQVVDACARVRDAGNAAGAASAAGMAGEGVAGARVGVGDAQAGADGGADGGAGAKRPGPGVAAFGALVSALRARRGAGARDAASAAAAEAPGVAQSARPGGTAPSPSPSPSPSPASLPTVVFAAVSLPERYVTDLGDPYTEQTELTVALCMARVRELTGLDLPHTIGYQGQAAQKPSVPNRIRWIGPDVEDEIRALGARGVRELVIVPVSFLFEQRGTLYVQDNVLRSLALSVGIHTVERVPTLGADAQLVDALADAVEGALPSLVSDVSPLEKAVDRGIPMHLTVVNDLLDLQRKGNRAVLELVPQEQPWGLSKKEAREAELINGRLAMAALALLVSQGVVVDRIFPGLMPVDVHDALVALGAR